MTSPDILNVDTAAVLLDIHPGSLRRLACDGRIPARKVGREWRFSRSALLSWLAGDTTEATHTTNDHDHRLDATAAHFINQALRQ